jgi:hypothetical protein
MRRLRLVLFTLSALHVAAPCLAAAQAAIDDRRTVLAVADSALAAISRRDFVALTDLMLDSGVVGGAQLGGRFSLRSRATERARALSGTITERGFEATVQLAGAVAVVWMPYDLYLNGAWSHCGVDTFTLMKSGERWRIAALIYSIEQPPACRAHPAGPPGS